jgi:hypothetical protein
MNIVQLQDQLKNFSQDQLVREMQMPSGNAPQFLVLGEIMRRKRMQDDFTAQQSKDDGGTVAQEAVAAAGVPQGGIADMARAMAPSTDMTQNTGVQAMYAGGPVKKMAAGDKIVRNGVVYIEQEDGSYLGEDGSPVDLDLAADDRTFGQRYIGDPLRELFQPVGAAARETLQPVGESMRETMRPVGEDLAQVLKGRPQEGYAFVPPSDPRLVPQPLTYDQIISRARSGSMPSSDQLQSSVGAGLLTGQQASDVQAMTEGTGYIPDAQEIAAAEAPGLSPVVPDDPRLVTDPYRLTSARTQVGQSISDYLGGISGNISVADQLKREKDRAAAIEETVKAPSAPSRADRDQQGGGIAAEKAKVEKAAEEKAAAEEAAKTPPDAPSGGAGGAGGAGGMSSFEQELMDALGRREKAAEQDKWLALAQVGLNLMSSTQPTLGGALGEAGLKGVEAARSARDQYDKDRLELLGALEQSRAARAKAAAGGRGGLTAYQEATLGRYARQDAISMLGTLYDRLGSLAPTGVPLPQSADEYARTKAQIAGLENELYGGGAEAESGEAIDVRTKT